MHSSLPNIINPMNIQQMAEVILVGVCKQFTIFILSIVSSRLIDSSSYIHLCLYTGP